MDAGEYDTNTLLINNISSVAFRTYEQPASQSSTYTFATSDVESALRSDGHLVYVDSVRRGIWCFHLTGKDGSSLALPSQPTLGQSLDVGSYKFILVEEGGFEPVSLLKSRTLGPTSGNTPNSSSPSQPALDTALRNTQAGSFSISQTLSHEPLDIETRASAAAPPEAKSYSTVPVKEIYEYFLAAVLASLTSAFCSATGAVALNSRSVVLSAGSAKFGENATTQRLSDAILVTFRVYLTTTGALLISLGHSSVTSMASSIEQVRSELISSGTPVLVAPLGAFATVQGIVDSDNSSLEVNIVQSPDTQISRRVPGREDKFVQWRDACAKVLELRGITSKYLHECQWLNIQHLRQQPLMQLSEGKRASSISLLSVWWPSTLCFWKRANSSASSRGLLTSLDNHQGFDALCTAQNWFQSNQEREEILSKRTKDRETQSARDGTEADGQNQHANGYSPLALRRASNNGAATAAGAMYPTPPDGVQNPVGVTPSFDGVVSSPGTTTAAVGRTDMDINMTNSGQTGDPFGEPWDSGDHRRDQQGSSFTAEPENIFGDIGTDMFADNDITDADFSFFDEQPGGADLDFSAVADIGATLDEAANLGTNGRPILPDDPESLDAKLMEGVVSPVFAKPELKHARSSLGEEARPTMEEKHSHKHVPAGGMKRPPSPFNQETVFKRVKASLEADSKISSIPRHPSQRRASIFERVDFTPFLSLNNKKYEENGRFNYQLATQKESIPFEPQQTPSMEYLQRHGKGRIGHKERPMNIGALLASITSDIENATMQRDVMKIEEPPSDADDISLVSDEDDTTYTPDEPSSPAKSAVMRRRFDDDAISLATSLREIESVSAPSPQASAELFKILSSDLAELSISRYFADPEPPSSRQYFGDEEFMTIAQVLTEQAVSGCLRLDLSDDEIYIRPASRRRRVLGDQIRNSVEALRSVLPGSLGTPGACSFKPFMEVQDVPLQGQPSRLQPRPPGGIDQHRMNLFQILAPHFELRRYDSRLSVAPSAIAFWELLGLGPSPGQKDIHAACIYPNHEGMSDNVSAFLDRTRILYEAMKLGAHDRLPSAHGVSDGLVPFDSEKMTTPSSMPGAKSNSAVAEQMDRLSHALAAQEVSEKNFVIYIVYSPGNASSITDACDAFHQLFELYKAALSVRSSFSNELVLQLLPMDFICSETTLAVPESVEYMRLCIEVYDRCTLFGGPMPSPAIVLEQPLPRVIDFKLSTTPSGNLLHENSCMHIAYAQSVDGRWVTAAWTDNRGSKQMTASYCLSKKGKPQATPFTDVAHEIWDTTHDLIGMWKVQWRIIITKCGPMDQDEIDFWIDLGKTETKASIHLSLLTVDTDPSLQLVPPAPKIPATAPSLFYTTPVSTPQASIVSPEQSGNPATPMGAGSSANATTPGENAATEPDGDTTLVDMTDSTWGVVLSHRLTNPLASVDSHPVLASGYLVKRGGPRVEDPPVAMEVNVIHSEGTPRIYDNLLREMLTYFRGLGTLARARGVVDRETDVRPWHVAAAEKGVRALYLLM